VTAASDTAYGRRGGCWLAHHPGRLLAEIRVIIAQARAEGWEPADLSRLFHPETIAATHAHKRGCGGRTHPPGDECPARPDPDELAGIWAGRARQALARHDPGADPQ
jgi:hypothetical protein